MGKFYYDLLEEREKLEREDIALVRIEQLFPSTRRADSKSIIDTIPKCRAYVWAQEEPKIWVLGVIC